MENESFLVMRYREALKRIAKDVASPLNPTEYIEKLQEIARQALEIDES